MYGSWVRVPAGSLVLILYVTIFTFILTGRGFTARRGLFFALYNSTVYVSVYVTVILLKIVTYMNTNYFLRVNTRGEPVLYARVYANRSDYSDFSLKFISNNLDDFKTQQRIKAVDEKLQEIITNCLRDGTCSARIVKETYQKETESASRTMRDLFAYWIENQSRRVKWNEIKEVTLRRHLATQTHLKHVPQQAWYEQEPGLTRRRMAKETGVLSQGQGWYEHHPNTYQAR